MVYQNYFVWIDIGEVDNYLPEVAQVVTKGRYKHEEAGLGSAI